MSKTTENPFYDLFTDETRLRLAEKVGDAGAKALFYDYVEAVADLDRARQNFAGRSRDLREKLERAERESAEAVFPSDFRTFGSVYRLGAETAAPEIYYLAVEQGLARVYYATRAIQAVLGDLPTDDEVRHA